MRTTFLPVILLLQLLLATPAHAGGHDYEISLDRVLLHERWGAPDEPPYPTHAIMGVRVRRGDEILDQRMIGHGPDDANLSLWSAPALSGEGDGWIGVLHAGVPVYPGWPYVLQVRVPDDATLEVWVILARATWFSEEPFVASAQDRKLIALFSGVVGWVSGNLVDLLLDDVMEDAFGSLADAMSEDEVVIPCWGLMRDELISWNGWELAGGSRAEIGPGGGRVWHGCPAPKLSYVVNVSRTSFEFPPVEPGGCELRPVRERPAWMHTVWTDVGDTWAAELVARLVQLGSSGWYLVSAEELQAPPVWPVLEPVDDFAHDRRAGEPLRVGPFPVAPECSHFTNVEADPSVALDLPPPPSAGGDSIFAPDLLDWLFGGDAMMAWPEAITWRLDGQTALHLYGEYRGNQRVAYRLRYVRTGANGERLADVMLSPGEDALR